MTKIIRKNPLFELYVENDLLIINNTQDSKDNGPINLKDIENIVFIRKLCFSSKVIQVTLGLHVPAKSELIRIFFNEGFKDILVSDCESKKVENLIHDVNYLILKQNRKP